MADRGVATTFFERKLAALVDFKSYSEWKFMYKTNRN